MITSKTAAVITALMIVVTALPARAENMEIYGDDSEAAAVVFGAEDQTEYTSEDSFVFSNGAVTGYSGEDSEIVIPPSIGGQSVTSVGASAFRSNAAIKSVILPDSVTAIGASAFRSCGGLESITIPASVTSIGNSAFSGCSGLNNAFYKGTSEQWSSISVSGGNSFLINAVLCGEEHYKTEEGYLGYTGSEIIDYKGTDQALNIPQTINNTTIEKISAYAFKDSKSITGITIPEGITEIGEGAFSGCASLETLNYNAVSCEKANAVFAGNTLKNIYIGDMVKRIPESAFLNCETAENITIPVSVESIGRSAFKNTAVYNDTDAWKSGVLYLDGCLIEAVQGLESDYNIEEGTRLIADGAFDACDELMLVTVPSSVKHLSGELFRNVKTLQLIEIDPMNPYFSSEDNVLFSKDKTELIAYPSGKKNIEYRLPDSVSKIRESAFSGNEFIERAEISEGVNSIEKNTFSGCAELSEIVFDGSIESIGEGAFSGCARLESISLNEGLRSIGSRAFYGCEGIEEITIPGSLEQAGEGIFEGCGSLRSVSFSDGTERVDRSFFDGLEDTVLNITLPQSVKVIDKENFKDMKALVNAELGEETVSIGAGAFSGCSAMTKISIPPSVKEIGEGAFTGCGALKQAETEGLESWCMIDFADAAANPLYCGAELTVDNESVKEIYLPASAREIKRFTFVNYAAAERIDIPSGIRAVSDSAFYGCAGVVSVNMDKSVKSIARNAFYGCDSIATVCYSGSKENFSAIAIESGNTALTAASCLMESYAAATEKGTIAVGKDGIVKAYAGHDTSIVIPDEVNGIDITEIAERVFKNNTELAEIIIGNNVKRIGTGAFSGCTSLNTLRLGEQVSRIIGTAFEGCSQLKDIYMWDSMILIGKAAFRDCSAIGAVHYRGSESEWKGITVGADNEGLLNAVIEYEESEAVSTENGNLYIYDGIITAYKGRDSKLVIPESWNGKPITRIASSAFSQSKITSAVIPQSVTSIGSGAFAGSGSLTYVYIPDSVTDIGSGIFGKCVKLTGARLPDNIKKIPAGMFEGCSSLRGIAIPGKTERIDASAFRSSGLESIYIPDSVSIIAGNAFAGCGNMKTMVAGSGVTEICEGAFGACTALEDAVIGENVWKIEKGAFSDCTALKRLSLPEAVDEAEGAFLGCPESMSVFYGSDAEQYGRIAENIAAGNKINYNSKLYYIVYDAEGETLSSAPLTAAYEYGSQADSPEEKVYAGWSDAREGELLYKAGQPIIADRNMLLYPLKSYIRISNENGKRNIEAADILAAENGCKMYTAVYDGESRLISLKRSDLNENAQAEASTDMTDADAQLKVFFWDDGFAPFCPPIEETLSGTVTSN